MQIYPDRYFFKLNITNQKKSNGYTLSLLHKRTINERAIGTRFELAQGFHQATKI